LSKQSVSESRGQNKGAVLRLRNLAMIENIRRAEDPAWTEALERQQTVARLGRRFRGEELSLEALLDYALALKEGAASRTETPSGPAGARSAGAGSRASKPPARRPGSR